MKLNQTQRNDLCLLSASYRPTATPAPIIHEGNELPGRAQNKGIKEGKTAVVIYLIWFALVGRIEDMGNRNRPSSPPPESEPKRLRFTGMDDM